MTVYTPTASLGSLSVAYQEGTADVSISATTEATANTIITAPTFTPNGVDSFWVEFGLTRVDTAAVASSTVIFVLYDNGAVFGGSNASMAQITTVANVAFLTPIFVRRKIQQPTAVAHAYSIRAYESGGTATARGAAPSLPIYVNITRDF